MKLCLTSHDRYIVFRRTFERWFKSDVIAKANRAFISSHVGLARDAALSSRFNVKVPWTRAAATELGGPSAADLILRIV